MNKKFKILMLTLVLFSSSTATTNFSAAGFGNQSNAFFSSVGGFFGNLFGGNQEYTNPLYKDGTVVPMAVEDTTGADVGDFASNTAYAEDKDTGSVDQGTGIIALSSDLQGIVSTKTIEPNVAHDPDEFCDYVAGGSAGEDCLGVGEETKITIEVRNTGNKPNETFTIIDPLDSYSDSIVYDSTQELVFTADADDATSANTMTMAKTTIGDLTTTGAVITGIDPGEIGTITFTVTTPNVVTTDDYLMQNQASVCTPFGSTTDYSYVHTNDLGNKDGQIINLGSGSYSLCSYPYAEFPVDGNGDGSILIPDVDWLNTSKTVVDEDGDGIAEAGEKLTYTLYAKNVGDADNELKITDALDEPSMANVNFTYTDNLTLSGGGDFLDPDGKPYTIAQLKTGITLTLTPEEEISFEFSGTVNTPIDTTILQGDKAIRNIAKFCETKTSGACEEQTKDITTDKLASMAKIDKNVVLKDVDGNETYPTPGPNPVVDTTSVASGAVPVAPKAKPVIEYHINITSVSSVDSVDELKISDLLPRASYLDIDPADILTVNINDIGTTGNTEITTAPAADPNYTIAQISDPQQLEINLGAGDSIEISFPITLKDEIYTDTGYTIGLEGALFTNKAILELDNGTDTGEAYDVAWATMNKDVTGPVDGDFDMTKYVGTPEFTDGTDPTNVEGKIDAGDTMHYNIDINNNTPEPVVYSVYDSFADATFDLDNMADPALTPLTVANGTFVADKAGTAITTAPTTVGDLNDPTAPVYVQVAGNSTAILSFDIILDDDFPADATDPSDKVVNNAYTCSQLSTNVDDFSTITNILKDPECTTDSEISSMSDAAMIYVTKEASDVGGTVDGKVAVDEQVEYTLTVQNTSNSDKPYYYTLTDLFVDPNLIRDESAVVDVDLGGDGSVEDQITFGDLLAGYEPRKTTGGLSAEGLEKEKVDTFTYTLDPNIDNKGNADPTDDEWANKTTGFIYNAASAEIKSPVKAGQVGKDYAFNKIEKFNNTIPDNVTDAFIQKVMVENGKTPGSTSIEAGDSVDVHYIVANTSPTDSPVTVNVMEQDVLDPNIDWTLPANQSSAVTIDTILGEKGKFVTSTEDDTEIASVTVADLVDTTPKITQGIYVNVEPKSIVDVHFTVSTVAAAAWTPSATVDNTIAYCTEIVDVTKPAEIAANCDNSTASIPTVGFEKLDVVKEVTNSMASDGKTVNKSNNSTPVDPKDDYFFGTDGATVSYKVTATNSGSLPIDSDTVHTLKFKDEIVGSAYFNVDGTEDVTITEYDSTGASVNTASSKLNALNGGLAYTEALEPGNSLEFTFDVKLASNLSDFLVTDNTIPNVADVCFDPSEYYVDGGTGIDILCVSGNNELPYQNGTPVTDPDDPSFSIIKKIDDSISTGSVNAELEPGEKVLMSINVTNTDFDASGNYKEILLTDEFADLNFNYEAVLSSGKLTIKDTTPGSKVYEVNYAKEDDKASLDTPQTGGVTGLSIDNLLPNAEADYVDPLAYDRWGTTYTDPTKVGGVWLRIPADHTYTVSFEVSAKGDLKMATRIKNVFDFRKYFA